MKREKGDLSIGVMSKQTGVNIETIRYYERAGLLPGPPRTQGGHRVYSQTHMHRLQFIRRGRELGFSVDEIRALLGLVDGGFTCAEVQTLTLKHLADVQAKISDLKRLETTLAAISSQCTGDEVPDCPVIEALSGDVP